MQTKNIVDELKAELNVLRACQKELTAHENSRKFIQFDQMGRRDFELIDAKVLAVGFYRHLYGYHREIKTLEELINIVQDSSL